MCTSFRYPRWSPLSVLLVVDFIGVGLTGCGDQSQEDEEKLTIVVKEDKQTLIDERTQLEKVQKELNEALAKVGRGAGSEGSSALSREETERILQKAVQGIGTKLSLSQIGAPMREIGGGGASTAEIRALHRQQQEVKQELVAVRQDLKGIETAIKELGDKIGRAPAMAALPVARPLAGKAVKPRKAEVAYNEVTTAMSKKGLMMSDLPVEIQPYNTAIKKAMAESDYALAYEYTMALADAIKGLKIDRGFLNAKMSRLAEIRRQNPPEESLVAEVDRRFERLTKLYTDGSYARANAEINQIIKLLRKH